MKKLKNTLYITNPNYYLGRDGRTIEVRDDNKMIAKFPIHNFENIVCFNYTGVSPGLLKLCGEEEVTVTYLTANGKYIGSFDTEIRGSILTRKRQYLISTDEEKSLPYAKLFILAKVQNKINNLQRFIRDHGNLDTTNIEKNLMLLKKIKPKIVEANTKAILLGHEGNASRAYFSSFNDLILSQKEDFIFDGRNKRPPLDYVNALLSLTYSFLRVKAEGGLYAAGLDPYLGFYHVERPGRTSLALDIMEELRPYLADRLVLSLINRNQITKHHFIVKSNGAVILTEEGFKKFIKHWNDQLLDNITHPFLEEKIEKGLLPYAQSMLLSKAIREELDLYPPFFSS